MITIYSVIAGKSLLYTQDYKYAQETYYAWVEKYPRVSLHKTVFNSIMDCLAGNALEDVCLRSFIDKSWRDNDD